MNRWYKKIVLEQDLGALDDAIHFFNGELLEARREVKIEGNLEQQTSRLPALFEHRFAQQQEIDHILDYMNTELKRIRSHHFRRYLEKYNRDLSSSAIEKYIDGEDDVIVWKLEINKLSLLSNQFTGVLKSFDIKHWQLNNIIKARSLGIEDIEI